MTRPRFANYNHTDTSRKIAQHVKNKQLHPPQGSIHRRKCKRNINHIPSLINRQYWCLLAGCWMLSGAKSKEFGRHREPHRIIIAHGDTVQDFVVRPWIVSCLFITGLLFSALYLSATAYLVFRDDIITFSRSEQAQIKSEYEDRIVQLRSQIDRIASRQMLDQQALQSHVQKPHAEASRF